MTRPALNPGQWPRLMRAETAAAYVDESSVEAFLRRAGKVYPPGRKVSGRGQIWLRDDLDTAISTMKGARGSLADDL